MVEGAILEKDHDQVIDGNRFRSPDLTGRTRNRYRRRQILRSGAAGPHEPGCGPSEPAATAASRISSRRDRLAN